MYKNWASDDEVTKYLTWPTHSSIDVSKFVLEKWVSSYSDEKYYQWAIVLKENGDEPVGSISAVNTNEDVSMVHIGYCIGKTWWKKGSTSEAMRAVMDFFFDRVNVNRIEARHNPRNPNSGLPERIQFFVGSVYRMGYCMIPASLKMTKYSD